ncbi:serine/threonine-protein kinase AtPK2/AtPK19-like [Olea europaea var. sylvestris]|uniref:serine/threonine-protein kinase AtPK2/AtPK19-like n=1 Tax=Olea europaea var. sylvestris TaxID=158386 RepID=UPI000C1CEC6A|nr:serine/threonine-protein kinase AtPK2/AtPK19-like [Olea europaea var. sylvestris]
MVTSQFPNLTGDNLLKPFPSHVPLSVEVADAFSLDHVDLDFSDLFGPAPTRATLPLISEDSANFIIQSEVKELNYDEPAVIHSCSHSYVGPTSCLSNISKLNKLTLHERGYLFEFVDEVDGEAQEKIPEAVIETIVPKKFTLEADGNSEKTVRLEDFEFLKVVGQGAFGKVYQVRKIGSSEIFAMKVMRKDKIIKKNHAEYMKTERDILTKIDHPFIVKLRYSFQTKYRLYLVLDFINGGHLFFQLYRQGLFREDLARIYAAEIVSAVSHLHAKGIMHRDLKPENIILDAEGHAMLTDFGLAKQFDENTRSNSLCGTVEYMAPEIIRCGGHDKAADWWSVGILLYEMLTGKPPFVGGNRHKIQQKILNDKIKLPAFLSSEAHSLLKGLLQKEANMRLGNGLRGSDEIKGHKWFKSISWKKLEAREIQPSFLPLVAGKHCIANFDERWTNMPLLDSPAASPKCGENPFRGFSYVKLQPSTTDL